MASRTPSAGESPHMIRIVVTPIVTNSASWRGSKVWTCMSARPGMMNSPRASIVVAPAGAGVESVGPTATIRSPCVITVVWGRAPSRSIGITVASTNATTGAGGFGGVGSGFGGDDDDDDLPHAARATIRARRRTAGAYAATAARVSVSSLRMPGDDVPPDDVLDRRGQRRRLILAALVGLLAGYGALHGTIAFVLD